MLLGIKGRFCTRLQFFQDWSMEVLHKRRELAIEKKKFADLGIFRGFAHLAKLRTLHKGRISVRHSSFSH